MRFSTKDESGDDISVIDLRTVTKVYEPVTAWYTLREQCEKYMAMYNNAYSLKVCNNIYSSHYQF